MSGNPFRLSLQQKQPAVSHSPAFSSLNAPTSRADAAAPHIDTVIPSSAPRSTKKVRIKTPTSSPPPHSGNTRPDDSIEQRSNLPSGTSSLPPVSAVSSSDSLEDSEYDPFGPEARRYGDEDETLMRNTTGTASTGGSRSAPTNATIPANPFQKTLATMEPLVKSTQYREGLLERQTPEKTGSGTARASMDVDAFTRLLMTGVASPSSSGASTAPQNPNVAGIKIESSSSTDTSSISRNSIFESIHESHNETPRTSYEMAASDDEDQTSLMGERVKVEKKKPKPPPPKPRHGKLVAARTPQTVSFSDFSPSFVEPTTPPTSSSKPATSPISNRSWTDSDLNKPLPPPPEPSYFPPETQQTPHTISAEPLAQTPSPEPSSTPQRRVPPAPPLARRHSTLRSATQNRSRSNSNLTISSQLSDTPSPYDPPVHSHPQVSSSSSSSTHKPPPPPPPSRRHGTALTGSANVSNSDIPFTRSVSNSSAISASSATATVTSPPPVPASRRSTLSSPPPSPSLGLARTSSINSTRSYHPDAPSSSIAPPPPPPPRRRGRGSADSDGRASLDGQRPSASALAAVSPERGSRRTSGEGGRRSFDGHGNSGHGSTSASANRRASQASESGLRYEYVGPSGGGSGVAERQEVGERDAGEEGVPVEKVDSLAILDDMERLQREVDALREKYGGT